MVAHMALGPKTLYKDGQYIIWPINTMPLLLFKVTFIPAISYIKLLLPCCLWLLNLEKTNMLSEDSSSRVQKSMWQNSRVTCQQPAPSCQPCNWAISGVGPPTQDMPVGDWSPADTLISTSQETLRQNHHISHSQNPDSQKLCKETVLSCSVLGNWVICYAVVDN